MEIQSSHTTLLIITIFMFSLFVFLGAFQLYYQYTLSRASQGQNVTAEETDKILGSFKEVPSWMVIVYFAAIGVIIAKLLSRKKDSTAKMDVDKFKYK